MMYHNQIKPERRQEYLDLLTKAERLLPSLLRTPENLPVIRKAASAVRGSELVIGRIKCPLTSQHVNILADLLKKSRTYVNNFWTTSATSSTPAPSVQVVDQSPPSPSPMSASGGSTAAPVQHVVVPQPPIATSPLSPLTPSSLSQYIHTLSPKLQRQATILPQKYAELNDRHESLDRLVADELKKGMEKSADAARERAYYANKIDKAVRTIDAFWLRVHAERQAQQGKPVTKEYQQFLDEEEKKYPMGEKKKNWADYTKAEIDQLEQQHPDIDCPLCKDDPQSPTLRQLTEARKDRDKKLCRRGMQRPTARAKQERILAMQELHEWDIFIEKKQWEVLQTFGIEVPKEWLNPSIFATDEDRKRNKKEYDRLRYEKNRPLEVKMKIASGQRWAKYQDNPYKE